MRSKFKWLFALFIAFTIQLSFAQQKTVTGKVTSEDGAVAGAVVKIVGTNNAVSTGFDGSYSIKAKEGDVLEVSYVGLPNKTMPVVSGNVINFSLAGSKEIEIVTIVNTLGVEVKKGQQGTASSKVKGNAVKASGESSLIKGLSGKASNVSVVSNSGDPGSGSYIQIRGQNTITGNTQPLFVIDGIPVSNDEIGSATDGVGQQSRMNDINPNDVENVQILKGASAAALWGFRAANGVVLITTKKGKGGKMQVNLNTTFSQDQVNLRFKTQDLFGQGSSGIWSQAPNVAANSYGDLISRRAGGSDVFNTTGSRFVAQDGTVYFPITAKRSKENFNDSNYDAVIGTGYSLDKHLSLSGGNANGSYYLGLGHLEQQGIIRGSDYERTSVDFNTTFKLSDKTTAKGKFNYSSINANRVQQGSNTSGLLLGLYRTPADFDNSDYIGTNINAAGVRFENAHRSYRRSIGNGTYGAVGYNNPLWTTDKQQNTSKVNHFIAGLQIQHEFSKKFSILGRFGIDNSTDERITLFPKNSQENTGLGSASDTSISLQQYNVDVMALGDFELSENLSLNYTLGVNTFENKFYSTGGSYKNFLVDSDVYTYDNAITADKNSFLNRELTRANGAYFSTAFDYKKFLFVTLGGRYETASTFAPNLKGYFYPSAEVAYLFSKNIKENTFLTNGKLRLTAGQVAINPPFGVGYSYFIPATGAEGYGPAYDAAAYNGGLQRSGLRGNPNLKPEIKTEYEGGIDLEFFNRVNINATYYTNTIKDNLVNVPINGSSSYSALFGNFAEIQNNGIEIDLNINILKDTPIKWSIYGNWSKNTNEVTKLENTTSLFLNGFAGSSSRAVLGQPLGVLWGGKWDRNPNGSLILDSNGFPTVAAAEGVIGDPNPDWRGGLGTRVEYKGFSLNALFDASIGGDLWDGTNGALNNFGKTVETANITTFPNQAAANAVVNYDGVGAGSPSLGGWTNADGTYSVRGNETDFGGPRVLLNQAFYQSIGGGFGPVSEQFIKSASWVKFRELSLGYSFNKNIIRKSGLEEVSITLTGRNLWLWTEAKNLYQDPETNLTGGSNGRGLQYFNHPNSKSFLVSLNIKF
jgi:TonB-linked SusC/RagA family outer membrane protein